MRPGSFLTGVFLCLPLVFSCKEEAASQKDPGSLDVAISFDGIQPPTRINLYLISADDVPDCASVGLRPGDVAAEVKRSLPYAWPFTTEGVVFEELPADSEWLVVGIGMAGSAEVAFGCEDEIIVDSGVVAYNQLVLGNEPMPVDGTYTSALEFDLGLTAGGMVSDALMDLLAELVCEMTQDCTEENEATRDLTRRLLLELADLDIVSEWTFTQSDDLVRGEVAWTHIEGVEVGPEWKILTGSFEGEIPGTTQMLLTSRDLTIDTLELARFLLQEVMEEDLDEVPTDLAELLPRVRLLDGLAEGVDVDFDRRADRIHGVFVTSAGVGGVDFLYGVTLPWTLSRVGEPPTTQE